MIRERKTVFKSPWCEVVGKTLGDEKEPYYSILVRDYVTVVGFDSAGRIAVVRQFRPAVETETWELPAGLVDDGEGPEVSAAREFWEETGFRPSKLIPLASPMFPDTGRLGNRIYYYLAELVTQDLAGFIPEKGIEVQWLSAQELEDAIDQGRFGHALHVVAFLLAQRWRRKKEAERE
jgi:ADP-ribose pyrophosphatase